MKIIICGSPVTAGAAGVEQFSQRTGSVVENESKVTGGFSSTRTLPLMSLPELALIANKFLGLLQTGLLACLKGGCCSQKGQTEQVKYICIHTSHSSVEACTQTHTHKQ